MANASLVRWFCRIYRGLLYAYPRDFRRRYGREMAQVFGDRCYDATQTRGLVGLLCFAARTTADWLATTVREGVASISADPQFSGGAQPAFDGLPTFYTSETYSPRRGALINGGVLSVGIFVGLYLVMSHWTSHAISSTALIGSHHQSRSHLFEMESPSAAPAELNLEILIRPERGRPKDVWSQTLLLLTGSPVPLQLQVPRMEPKQAAAGRKGAQGAAAQGSNDPKTGMKSNTSSEKPPGLWSRLRLFASAIAAPLSGHPIPPAPAGRLPVAAASSPQPEQYEEWDDPKGGFPAMYFRVILVLGALDADHDGIISSSEIANASAVLRGLDRNHDGKLTPDECGQGTGDAPVKGGVPERARLEFMRLHPVLAALDADHNGEISASEIQNAPAALKALDKNGDGTLTQDEVLPDPVAIAVGLVMRLDENGDGKISRDERSGELARRYRDLLDAADQNKVGVVTEQEVANEIRRRAVLTGILPQDQMPKTSH